ncbi:MAG TPA: hypothetical protein VFQ77_13190 [Pseudonocardiaceae bacterium]|nr:hypothetical protein [Pseudonocardiaceae bacterium]
MADVNRALSHLEWPNPERVWVGGMPLDARLAELAEAGMSRVDALLHLLEWAIRRRPVEEVELLRSAIGPEVAGMPLDVLSDLRWLQGFAALRTGCYAHALTVLAPLSQFDRFVDRPLGPQERGPQVLAAVLVAQVFRELGARSAAEQEATRALEWLGDLGATDFESCSATAGQVWKGGHLLGFELEVGLAEDALTDGDLAGARRHAVAARRWLPRRALDTARHGRVPWQHQVTLLLLWSKLSLARGWRTATVRSAEFARQLAARHQALPELARCWYQHGLAVLGTPFDPTQYLLDPGGRQPHRAMLFRMPLGLAAAMAESAGMPELACRAHLHLGALLAPHDRKLALLHIDRAMRLADRIAAELPPELVDWWELSRMAKLRLVHIIAHDVASGPQLWQGAATEGAEPPALDQDENEGIQPMQGIDDLPQPPELEGELRAALHQVGYALADETGAGAVIEPAADQPGLVVGWQPGPALDRVQSTISAMLVMKELSRVLETMGFLARRYEADPSRLIVKGTFAMLEADDEDDGDRAVRWYDSETEARRVQLGWLADTRVYDVAEMRQGVAGHPLRDLVVRILIALDSAGLPLQVDLPNDGFSTDIDLTVYPHARDGSYVVLSWEPAGDIDEYQREVFREGTRALIERVLNAAGIVTNGQVTDGSVYVFGKAQELAAEPTESRCR